MFAEFIKALTDRLRFKSIAQNDTLEKIKLETMNHFELEKQKREMDHSFDLAKYNADRESQRHHFNAAITLAGHALKSAILINGGAAVGMLTFIGHELQLPQPLRLTFALSLLLFVFGVLFAALATGFSYFAQHFFMEYGQCFGLRIWRSFAIGAIMCAYLFFGTGSLFAYLGFIN